MKIHEKRNAQEHFFRELKLDQLNTYNCVAVSIRLVTIFASTSI
jgi:hypothetical protein